MSLAEVMESLNADVLKGLAKRLGLPKTLTRKGEIIQAIEGYLATHLDDFLSRLTEAERLFLAEAAHRGGKMLPRVFEAKYQLRAPSPGWWSRSNDAPFSVLVLQGERYAADVRIPDELARTLRSRLPKPAEPEVKTADAIPAALDPGQQDSYYQGEQRPIHVLEGDKTVAAELRRVLSLVQAGKVRVQDKSRRPTDATVRLLSGCLVVPDLDLELPEKHRDNYTETAGPIRAHAWAVLVQQCGWAKPHGGHLVLTKAGKELLGGVPPDAFRQGFQRLLGDDQFDEFNRINHIRGQAGKAKRQMTSPSDRRQAICDSMDNWPIQRWISFDEAFRFVAASGHELDVTEAPYYLYFGELQYGSLGDAGDGMERQYLRAFLMESLATLGVVDIAYVYPHGLWPELSGSWGTDDMAFCGRYDGLLYVRLGALGAYCLGLSECYEPPAAEKRDLLQVLSNRELAISGGAELNPAERSTLELFAQQKGDHLWSLDPQRILDYVESGGSVEDVTKFLAQNTAEEIPQTVEVFLNDLTAKLDAVQGMERAILVEMKDAEAAARVAHDRLTKSLCRLAGDRYLAVPEKNEQAFRTALKKLGYVVPQ